SAVPLLQRLDLTALTAGQLLQVVRPIPQRARLPIPVQVGFDPWVAQPAALLLVRRCLIRQKSARYPLAFRQVVRSSELTGRYVRRCSLLGGGFPIGRRNATGVILAGYVKLLVSDGLRLQFKVSILFRRRSSYAFRCVRGRRGNRLVNLLYVRI